MKMKRSKNINVYMFNKFTVYTGFFTIGSLGVCGQMALERF